MLELSRLSTVNPVRRPIFYLRRSILSCRTPVSSEHSTGGTGLDCQRSPGIPVHASVSAHTGNSRRPPYNRSAYLNSGHVMQVLLVLTTCLHVEALVVSRIVDPDMPDGGYSLYVVRYKPKLLALLVKSLASFTAFSIAYSVVTCQHFFYNPFYFSADAIKCAMSAGCKTVDRNRM